MWSTLNFPEIVEAELIKFPWQSLKSTKPISDRTETLDSLFVSINSEYCSKVIAASPSVDSASLEISKVVAELETCSIMAQNSRLHFKEHLSSLNSIIQLLTLYRRRRRLLEIRDSLGDLEKFIVLRKSLRQPAKGLQDSLDRVGLIFEAVKKFPGLRVSSELSEAAGKELKIAGAKFREIIRTIIVDAESIPKKFLVHDIAQLSIQLGALGGEKKFPGLLIDQCCACVDSVARNSMIAIAEGAADAGQFSSVLLSLVEFFETVWDRFVSLSRLFEKYFLIETGDFLWDKISREILKIVGGARFDSEFLAAEIFQKISKFHAIKPDRGFLDAARPVFVSFASETVSKFQAASLSDLSTRNFQIACASISTRAKELASLSARLPMLGSELSRVTAKIHGTALRTGLSLYGDFPNFSASEKNDDIYDSQERFILSQRFFPLVSALLNFQGNSRPVPKSKRNNFHAFERYAVLAQLDQLIAAFPESRNFQVVNDSAREYLCERICQDLVSEALTRWATMTLQNPGDSFGDRFIAEAWEAIGTLPREDFRKSLTAVVAAQCLETLGLLPPGNFNTAGVDLAVDAFEAEFGASEHWQGVREYSLETRAETVSLDDLLLWCKAHSQLPLRLLAALISRKFPDEDITDALAELEHFFINFVRS